MPIKGKLKDIWEVSKSTLKKFSEDNAIYYSASLSYYTLFSLPPIIIIIITVAGAFLGDETISKEIYENMEESLGHDATEQIKVVVENTQKSSSSFLAKIVGVATLIFASTGIFTAVQNTLNIIWEVKARPKNNILKFLKDRLFSFLLIILLALILFSSTLIQTVLIAGLQYFESHLPHITVILIQLVNFIIPLAVLTVFFGMIFRYLPDVKIQWKDVWTGAFITAILFTLGKFFIGLYLGHTNLGSAYGAAGAVIVMLVWVFYSSTLIFLGAEFTHEYAKKYGRRIRPADYAVRVRRKFLDKDEPDIEG
jgi:membrane protein